MDRAISLPTYNAAESSCRDPTRSYAGWFSESSIGRSTNGQQDMANMMFARDRVPQRYMEAYQQMPEVQPIHRQDADAYWADKIAEVMRDQFGIKSNVNTYSY